MLILLQIIITFAKSCVALPPTLSDKEQREMSGVWCKLAKFPCSPKLPLMPPSDCIYAKCDDQRRHFEEFWDEQVLHGLRQHLPSDTTIPEPPRPIALGARATPQRLQEWTRYWRRFVDLYRDSYPLPPTTTTPTDLSKAEVQRFWLGLVRSGSYWPGNEQGLSSESSAFQRAYKSWVNEFKRCNGVACKAGKKLHSVANKIKGWFKRKKRSVKKALHTDDNDRAKELAEEQKRTKSQAQQKRAQSKDAKQHSKSAEGKGQSYKDDGLHHHHHRDDSGNILGGPMGHDMNVKFAMIMNNPNIPPATKYYYMQQMQQHPQQAQHLNPMASISARGFGGASFYGTGGLPYGPGGGAQMRSVSLGQPQLLQASPSGGLISGGGSMPFNTGGIQFVGQHDIHGRLYMSPHPAQCPLPVNPGSSAGASGSAGSLGGWNGGPRGCQYRYFIERGGALSEVLPNVFREIVGGRIPLGPSLSPLSIQSASSSACATTGQAPPQHPQQHVMFVPPMHRQYLATGQVPPPLPC